MSSVFSQMAYLFSLIALGYLLVKLRLVPEKSEIVLSKLENNLFIPALILGTFIRNFTVENVLGAKDVMLASLVIELVVIPLSFGLARLLAKDKYTRNLYVYGLCFANFGFMGNAVVKALYPDLFFEYLLFAMVLWVFIYAWAVPSLLMGDTSGRKTSFWHRLKAFLNPMFLSMVVGMALGLVGFRLPAFADTLVTTLGDCMSPVAMLLTGMTVARKRLSAILGVKSVYPITFLRLIVYPLIFIGLSKVIPMSDTLVLCGVCCLAMPLGLNTIVIPAAQGKDTTVASGMALVSHVLGCATIPLMLYLMNL